MTCEPTRGLHHVILTFLFSLFSLCYDHVHNRDHKVSSVLYARRFLAKVWQYRSYKMMWQWVRTHFLSLLWLVSFTFFLHFWLACARSVGGRGDLRSETPQDHQCIFVLCTDTSLHVFGPLCLWVAACRLICIIYQVLREMQTTMTRGNIFVSATKLLLYQKVGWFSWKSTSCLWMWDQRLCSN